MRFSRTQFIDSCKSFFRIEFTPQDITAYGGLELIRRYFRLIGLHRRVQSAFRQYQLGGDYRAVDMILVILALLFERHNSAGGYWDPGSVLENEIGNLLAMIDGRDVRWQQVAPRLERLGIEFEEEIDRAWEDELQDREGESEGDGSQG